MEIKAGQAAVVTGAASGIGRALAEAMAKQGCNVTLADIDLDGLAATAELVKRHGVKVLEVACDVSKEEAVQDLAAKARAAFGDVHFLFNNAGVSSRSDAWNGPLAAWEWVFGVNFWSVVHGIRAFLPSMLEQDSAYIINTASIAGLLPGFAPSYDASKHAVVAVTEDLYRSMRQQGTSVGVSVICPGWVRTQILDADRNWPEELGPKPADADGAEVVARYIRRAIDESMTPAAVADQVIQAVTADTFWIFPDRDFLQLCVLRWADIEEGVDPVLFRDTPGLPSIQEIIEELAAEQAP